jgi:PPM family protein phosphatase
MRRIVAAGRTDVGQVRQGNEDALLIRDGLFAVADGMGGHQAGEVASATALEIVESLHGHVFQDADAAIEALRNAVVEANETVSKLADDRPEYRGMGTTLTVAMVEGRRVHIAHVGDSRAYLLREGQLEQITDDHTLVQHLVNEGQISRQEAQTHPQRSIITRAIGVSPDVEVDTMTFDLRTGDQLLLCSDGLTGVVADQELAERLVAEDDAEETVQDLVDRANAGGGPDNITVVLLRYEERDGDGPTETRTSTPISIRSRSEGEQGDWASGVGRYGDLSAGGSPQVQAGTEDEPRRANAILGRASAIVLAVAVLVGLVVFGGQFLLSRSYFVALDEEQVVIYEGIDASIGPLDLARVVERTELEVDDVQEWYRPTLESGRPATDISDARNIVAGIPVRDDAEVDPEEAVDTDEGSGEDEGDAAGSP